MKKGLALFYFLAVLISAAIGYVDTHTLTDDNLPIVLILLFVTFLFGVAQPGQAWQWALIIGLGVPVAHFIGRLLGFHPPYPVEPNVLITFIALIPSFVGAYLGVLTRMLVRSFASQ